MNRLETLLFALQVLTGLTTLSLLGVIIVKAYQGYSPERLSRWTLGLTTVFVLLTLLRQ